MVLRTTSSPGIRSLIPARIDRLPWSRFHSRLAGYLTVSEVFPLEVRAKAIAVFFAIAQCFGFLGTHLYGHLIGTGKDPTSLYIGYLIGAGAMIVGGLVAAFLGVDAERRPLEDVARPLSVIAKPAATSLSAGGRPQSEQR
ncbi:MAG TPA: hypothetical protein VEV45_20445 [Streptosporangiaceae bacterium]|nr:hypothetical protein [Streptosporangiaceae bacterium]